MLGHTSKGCDTRTEYFKKYEDRVRDCSNCGQKGETKGHYSAECPKARKSSNDNHACFRCGDTKHRIRTCTAPKTVKCSKCGLHAHCDKMHDKVMEWRSRRGYEMKKCGNCNKDEHVKLECPEQKNVSFAEANNQDSERRCYKCNKTGHIMADCVGHPNV